MNDALSHTCPRCDRLAGRLYRLTPEEGGSYRALQRCDMCHHQWACTITVAALSAGRLSGVSYASGRGAADRPKAKTALN